MSCYDPDAPRRINRSSENAVRGDLTGVVFDPVVGRTL